MAVSMRVPEATKRELGSMQSCSGSFKSIIDNRCQVRCTRVAVIRTSQTTGKRKACLSGHRDSLPLLRKKMKTDRSGYSSSPVKSGRTRRQVFPISQSNRPVERTTGLSTASLKIDETVRIRQEIVWLNKQLEEKNLKDFVCKQQNREAAERRCHETLLELLELLEARRDQFNQDEKYLICGLASEMLRYVRCDGWCYVALWEWMKRDSPVKQFWMVELFRGSSESRQESINHYCLLYSPRNNGAPPVVLDGSKEGGELLVSRMEKQGMWLYDPTFGDNMAVTKENLSQHNRFICEQYGYRCARLSLAIIHHFSKDRPLTPQQVAGIRQKTCQLLPVAHYLQQRRYTQGNNLYGICNILLNRLDILPGDGYPAIFRNQAHWT
ncbi:MAG: hypothetical protein MI749_18785, partial [Desulfovibrionales bacterium]|nr:hypothetical protein [Desulfovibrionales bacterium]